MKRLAVAFAALLISGCASTSESGRNPHVQITWTGTYTGNRVSAQQGADGVVQNQLSNALLIKSTTKIPARQGIRFGVQYRVTGIPESAVVQLRRLVKYPSPGALVPSAKAPLPYDEIEVQCAASDVCITGYGLDQPWEVIPGRWTYEFWSGDRLLAEQSFTVVRQ